MRHLLSDPAFPDIVGQWAQEAAFRNASPSRCAHDNGRKADAPLDPLLALVAKAEIEATRLW